MSSVIQQEYRLCLVILNKSFPFAKTIILGYSGYLTCPDPQEFCTVFVKRTCEYGCNGHGTCQNSVCVCEDGWDPNYSCGVPIIVNTNVL